MFDVFQLIISLLNERAKILELCDIRQHAVHKKRHTLVVAGDQKCGKESLKNENN